MEIPGEGIFIGGGIPPEIKSLRITVRNFLPYVVDSVHFPDQAGVIDLGAIELDPGCTVRGVLRGPNGEKVNQGWVDIRDNKGNSASAETNQQGEFKVAGLLAGPGTLYANVGNMRGRNPWVGPEGSKVIINEHQFTILEGDRTSLGLHFPPADLD
jgi:hypothetical protein